MLPYLEAFSSLPSLPRDADLVKVVSSVLVACFSVPFFCRQPLVLVIPPSQEVLPFGEVVVLALVILTIA